MMIEGSGRPKKHVYPVDPDPQHCFKEVLDSIEQHRLLSPLLVVSTLSTCPTATLGVVRFVTLAPPFRRSFILIAGLEA
jgi:hypothetical protein